MGRADYTLWYDLQDTTGTNLVIVEHQRNHRLPLALKEKVQIALTSPVSLTGKEPAFHFQCYFRPFSTAAPKERFSLRTLKGPPVFCVSVLSIISRLPRCNRQPR
jgi:hypothetical protein